jgi:hypothetical protein
MATRSRIGIQLKEGSVLSVYCHWDGYPEFNGKKLKEHFGSYEQAAELIDGGDISSLWTDTDWQNMKMEDRRTLYYAERGEEDQDVEPNLHNSFQSFISSVNDSWCDYAYLFTNGEWKCYTPKGNEEQIPA